MKKIVIYVAAGGMLGCLITTWLGPKAITWYFQPPVNIGVDCSEAIDWALHRLIFTQFIGLLCGLVVGLVTGLTYGRRKQEPMNG